MNYLLTFAICLFVLGIMIIAGPSIIHRLGNKEPEVKRKWTDPSKHE